jgi:hypothetical protein
MSPKSMPSLREEVFSIWRDLFSAHETKSFETSDGSTLASGWMTTSCTSQHPPTVQTGRTFPTLHKIVRKGEKDS